MTGSVIHFWRHLHLSLHRNFRHVSDLSGFYPQRGPVSGRHIYTRAQENVHAYICRSFSEPVWVDLFTNPVMQKAVLMAQAGATVGVTVSLAEKDGSGFHQPCDKGKNARQVCCCFVLGMQGGWSTGNQFQLLGRTGNKAVCI